MRNLAIFMIFSISSVLAHGQIQLDQIQLGSKMSKSLVQSIHSPSDITDPRSEAIQIGKEPMRITSFFAAAHKNIYNSENHKSEFYLGLRTALSYSSQLLDHQIVESNPSTIEADDPAVLHVNYIDIEELWRSRSTDFIEIGPDLDIQYHINRRLNFRYGLGIGVNVPFRSNYSTFSNKYHKKEEVTTTGSSFHFSGFDQSSTKEQLQTKLFYQTNARFGIDLKPFEQRRIFVNASLELGTLINAPDANAIIPLTAYSFKLASVFP